MSVLANCGLRTSAQGISRPWPPRVRNAPRQPQADRGDALNILVQHLRREIFSEAEFGGWTGKFCREIKGKFCLPDREFESYTLRHIVLCFSREILLSEIIAEYPQVSLDEVGASDRSERSLENCGAL